MREELEKEKKRKKFCGNVGTFTNDKNKRTMTMMGNAIEDPNSKEILA